MQIKIPFSEYKPWGGAIVTYEKIEEEGKLKELEKYLDDFFFAGTPTDEEVNDVLWYEDEDIFNVLNIGED